MAPTAASFMAVNSPVELKVGEGGMGDQEFKVILSFTRYPTRSNREQGISWPKKEEGATQAGAALC